MGYFDHAVSAGHEDGKSRAPAKSIRHETIDQARTAGTLQSLLAAELAVGHLKVYREAAPGFSGAFLMLGAPQIGVRHSRRLVGLRKVSRQQWDSGHVFEDEIGVSPSLSPKTPNVSVPYGALVPEGLDGILGAGRHIACDPSSHTFLREIRNAGSPVRPQASRRHLQPLAARLRVMLPCARFSMNCSDKAPIYRLPWRLLLRKSHLRPSERGRR